MIAIRVFVEAAIDFPEEEIDFLADSALRQKLYALSADLREFLATAQQGALLRDGITLVLAGKPNAGKSSILNALAGQETAIVTSIAGTTRDVLREKINLDGIPLNIVDTAGLRETEDVVEQQGVIRAWNEIEKADAILYVVDCAIQAVKAWSSCGQNILPVFRNSNTTLLVFLISKIYLKITAMEFDLNDNAIGVSAKTGEGLSNLKHLILSSVGYQHQAEGVFSARRRHLSAIVRLPIWYVMAYSN